MELHALRVILLVVMTVDTLSGSSIRTKHIIINNTLIKVFQTALIDGQLLIIGIRRRYESVAEIGIDRVGRHMDAEGLKACPLTILAGIGLYLNGLTLGYIRELFPLIDVGLCLRSAADDLLAF